MSDTTRPGAAAFVSTPEGRARVSANRESVCPEHELFVPLPPLTRSECQANYDALDLAIAQWPHVDLSGMGDDEEHEFKQRIIIWNSLRTAFGEAIAHHRDVVSVYRWVNGTVLVFDCAGEQIAELQGPLTEELELKIRDRATDGTGWYGFPPDEPLVWGSDLLPDDHGRLCHP